MTTECKANLIGVARENAALFNLIRALRLKGYEVVEALDGSEFLGKLTEDNVGLVLLDVNFLEKGSYRLIETVKRHKRNVPIIVSTAANSFELERNMRSMGVFYYAVGLDNTSELCHVLDSYFLQKPGSELLTKQIIIVTAVS